MVWGGRLVFRDPPTKVTENLYDKFFFVWRNRPFLSVGNFFFSGYRKFDGRNRGKKSRKHATRRRVQKVLGASAGGVGAGASHRRRVEAAAMQIRMGGDGRSRVDFVTKALQAHYMARRVRFHAEYCWTGTRWIKWKTRALWDHRTRARVKSKSSGSTRFEPNSSSTRGREG